MTHFSRTASARAWQCAAKTVSRTAVAGWLRGRNHESLLMGGDPASARNREVLETSHRGAVALLPHYGHQGALAMEEPPSQVAKQPRTSKLDPYKKKIDEIIERYPRLSAVRVLEEISKGEEGYQGGITLVKDYLRTIRPARGRVYHEVFYEPGEAFQVDWGSCGWLQIGATLRKVSVLVAVLCFSRLCYIEFSLSECKAEFYRCLVNALNFFGGSPRKIIFDNLKTAVLSGAGRYATLHPEFVELCGHFYLEPIACAARDPESKGTVEVNVLCQAERWPVVIMNSRAGRTTRNWPSIGGRKWPMCESMKRPSSDR
ncbi:MAG: IS21 family transposase [Pirellulaceae bacterium]